MDENLACSDLCEEKGFQRQAELLRMATGKGGRVYLLVEHRIESNGEHDRLVEDFGIPPRALFLDQDEAVRMASLRNGQRLRQRGIEAFGRDPSNLTTLSEDELNRRVSTILGTKFELRSRRASDYGRFPKSATDEQMGAISRLFDKLHFYYVKSVEFGG